MCFNLLMFYYRVKCDISKEQLCIAKSGDYTAESRMHPEGLENKGITNLNEHVYCDSKEGSFYNSKA